MLVGLEGVVLLKPKIRKNTHGIEVYYTNSMNEVITIASYKLVSIFFLYCFVFIVSHITHNFYYIYEFNSDFQNVEGLLTLLQHIF